MRSTTKKSRGFTLIELMIAVVIVAILATIAIPAYTSYVQRARRTDAKTALLDLASLEERYFSVYNAYTTDSASLGYAAGNAWPYKVGSGYYQIAIPNVTAASTTAVATYSLSAAAVGSQTSDQCTSYTLDNTGLQGSSPGTVATCWK